ncbi:hypothetical protein RBH29_08860 [Herbivorax sp. ANBcel31]|uniref:hypothetical protein n=1 Tax=Herbivorax sp. ANBcel31 TaxID=3069754 RepID=UPI0027B0C667|nr:hypothetical protein [Herbivorax sp. ANBcel31]MDQ2086533.1 hypothetical protein [Herbivorax sp. ANBcel31]
MEKDNVEKKKEVEDDLVIHVYNHYQALALNQHHLINEKMTQYFLGNTFLFSGFIASLGVTEKNPELPVILEIRSLLPIMAIVISFIYAFFFILPAIKTLRIWSFYLKEIEKGYIKKKMVSDASYIKLPYEVRNISKKWDMYFSYVGIPLLIGAFVVLWGFILC